MNNQIVFVNGVSKCGCVIKFSDGGGEYSDVHEITLCATHSRPELESLVQAFLNLQKLAEVYRTAYEEARHDGLVNWEAATSLVEQNEELKRKLEAAERRIAELEAREVKLPPTLWYEHDDLPREIPVLSRRLVINALREAGVKIAAGIGIKGE